LALLVMVIIIMVLMHEGLMSRVCRPQHMCPLDVSTVRVF